MITRYLNLFTFSDLLYYDINQHSRPVHIISSVDTLCVLCSFWQCTLKIIPSLWSTETKTPSSSSNISITAAPATPQRFMTSLSTTSNHERKPNVWLAEWPYASLWKKSALAIHFWNTVSSLYTQTNKNKALSSFNI